MDAMSDRDIRSQPNVPRTNGASAPATNNPDKQPELEHREWYSRGYLPHFDQPELLQFITFRLADSLPREVAEALDRELRHQELSEGVMNARRRERIEAFHIAGTATK